MRVQMQHKRKDQSSEAAKARRTEEKNRSTSRRAQRREHTVDESAANFKR